jgi:hypothetical protein
MYECDWDLTRVPNGTMTVSFDVYDKAGNKNLGPNGTRYGLLHRPAMQTGRS